MELKASARFLPLAPGKSRPVVDLVRGLPVNKALETLRLSRQRASGAVSKLIRSALAAALEQHDVDAEALHISRAWVDEGPRRYWRRPRARGTWSTIRRRSSHINIVLSDGASQEEPPQHTKRSRKE